MYVRAGDPVQLRETLPKVKVWVFDKDKKRVPATLTLPEGWYALDDLED